MSIRTFTYMTIRGWRLTHGYRARYAHGSINTATDLLIAALPIKGIWQLQLVRRQRIALIAVLTLGWL
jgi:hypothetical protein